MALTVRRIQLPRLQVPPPLPTLATALGLAVLLALAAAGEPPTVPLHQAVEHEGGGPIRVAGTVTDVRPGSTSTRITLAAAGYALAVRAPTAGLQPVAPGHEADILGRLVRLGGEATLLVASPGDVAVRAPADAPRPSWSQVAADPEAWRQTAVWLQGTADASTLRDGDGHKVQLGSGAWVRGQVEALGVLRYAPACLCERFDALEVRPWTP